MDEEPIQPFIYLGGKAARALIIGDVEHTGRCITGGSYASHQRQRGACNLDR